MYALHHKTKQYLFVLLKAAIIVVAFYVVYAKMAGNTIAIHQIYTLFLRKPYIVPIALGLSVINWWLETLKWQQLANTLSVTSVKQALVQTLGAQTLAMITPARIGEYGAKAMYYKVADRAKVLALTFFHNMHQMLVTTILGVIGLLLLQKYLWVLGMLVAVGVVITITWLLKKQPVKGYSLQQLWHYYKQLPIGKRSTNLLLAFARYLVFSHQYYLLLFFLDVKLGYVTTLSIISAVYLLASVVPVMGLLDVVVKWGVAVWLFGLYSVPAFTVVVTTLLMWLLNIGLPGIIGIYMVIKFNWKPTEVEV